MDIFDEQLKPEEKEAGFTPEESDNDVFWVENLGKYPAELPDYKRDTNNDTEEANTSNEGEFLKDDDELEINAAQNSKGIFDTETTIVASENDDIQQQDTEEISFDDDFKNMLMQDINRTKEKQSKPDETILESDNVIEYGSASADENDIVNDKNAQVTADLMSLEIHTNVSEEPMAKAPEPIAVPEISHNTAASQDNNVSENTGAISEEKPEHVPVSVHQSSEKKSKKKFIIIAAAMVISVIAGMFGYNFYISKFKLQPDAIAIDSTRIDMTYVDSTHLADNNKVMPQDTAQKNLDAIDTAKAIDTVPKDISSVAKQQPVKPKYTSKNTPTPAKINKNQQDNGLYTVQIYASPSREDAELRLEMLRSKNIRGTITTQQIKDKTWYRVRFGNFTSYSEAHEAIQQHGFAQSWIERIK